MIYSAILYALVIFIVYTPNCLSTKLVGKEITYTVRRGDTIKNISDRYHVSDIKIKNFNGVNNPDYLEPGQKLIIPTKTIIPKTIENGIIINIPEFKLYYFNNGNLENSYKIAIGRVDWETPSGSFYVDRKSKNPTWRVPPGMLRKLNVDEKIVPPGPDNPLGKYWIGLSMPHIGLHSTNQPRSIGKAVSHGCMRLNPNDAENLFNDVEIGTEGEIIYVPVKLATKNGSIYIEVHEDIYRKFPNNYNNTINRLKEMALLELVDIDLLKEAIYAEKGVPVKINKYGAVETTVYRAYKKSTQLWNSTSSY